MKHTISSAVLDIIACSYCGHELRSTSRGAECSNCFLEYNFTQYGSLDLRLKRTKKYNLEFDIGRPLANLDINEIVPLKVNPQPEFDISDITVPLHLTKEILSYFPVAKSQDSLMLDLGCGGGIHKGVCERAGFQWVGLDYDSTEAPILGDVHSLPFASNSFDFVLSVAVLEHIRFPFVMMREVHRVLKANGKFVGTVAFLEPFHGGSFYHHSHLGIINCLQYGGFRVDRLSPSERWSGLIAQASMGLFPKMPGFLSRTIVYPVQLLHTFWWWAGSLVGRNSDRYTRVRNTTGAFAFVATKAES